MNLIKYLALSLCYAGLSFGSVTDIAAKLEQTDRLLKLDRLMVMGNSSLDKAQIVFLPEVHDDPKSLTTQLLLINREKLKNRPFMVLDESLFSMKRSSWDIFSQKSLEILAAENHRQNRQKYAPRDFEKTLQTLANKFRNQGQLDNDGGGLWGLNEFSHQKTPFFGWDTQSGGTLTARNVQMVKTLKTALKENKRILIMAGARHIPELEHLTSKKLLCDGERFNNMDQFFSTIRSGFGDRPELTNGVGATLPIYDFLSNSVDYAVIFSKDLYPELDQVVNQFKANKNNCLRL